MDILGVSVHLLCLVVNLNANESKAAIKCHRFIEFHKHNKYKFIFRKLHCFFLEKYLVDAYFLTPYLSFFEEG